MSTRVPDTYDRAPIYVEPATGRDEMTFEVEVDGRILLVVGFGDTEREYTIDRDDWDAIVEHVRRDHTRLRLAGDVDR